MKKSHPENQQLTFFCGDLKGCRFEKLVVGLAELPELWQTEKRNGQRLDPLTVTNRPTFGNERKVASVDHTAFRSACHSQKSSQANTGRRVFSPHIITG